MAEQRKGRARAVRAQKRQEKKHYKQNKAGMLSVSGIVIVLLIAMSTQIVKLQRQNEELDKKLENLTTQRDEELDRQQAILAYQEYVTKPEYIEQIAKTKLGLVYANEIIFKEQQPED